MKYFSPSLHLYPEWIAKMTFALTCHVKDGLALQQIHLVALGHEQASMGWTWSLICGVGEIWVGLLLEHSSMV